MKKTRKNKKGSKGSKTRVKMTKYPVEFLGVALLVLVLIETALLGNVSSTDVTSALGMFDNSVQIAEAGQTLMTAVEPMASMVSGINKFYALAAVEAVQLLDSSEQLNQLAVAVQEYGKFVGLVPSYPSQVAGVSIESCNSN